MTKRTTLFVIALAGCGTPAVDSQTLTACLSVVACGVLSYHLPSVSACLVYSKPSYDVPYPFFSPEQIACLSTARNDCTAVNRCLNDGLVTPCPASPVCSDGHFTSCGWEPVALDVSKIPVRMDCSTRGETCVGNQCGLGSCTNTDPTTKYQCNGDHIELCDNGVLTIDEECTPHGGVCGLDATGTPRCIGSGPPCADAPHQSNGPIDGIRCEGDVEVRCQWGHEARYDCTTVGAHCVDASTISGGSYLCETGADCLPIAFPSTCDGNTLVFCNRESIVRVDCKSAGFSGCNPDTGACAL